MQRNKLTIYKHWPPNEQTSQFPIPRGMSVLNARISLASQFSFLNHQNKSLFPNITHFSQISLKGHNTRIVEIMTEIKDLIFQMTTKRHRNYIVEVIASKNASQSAKTRILKHSMWCFLFHHKVLILNCQCLPPSSIIIIIIPPAT